MDDKYEHPPPRYVFESEKNAKKFFLLTELVCEFSNMFTFKDAMSSGSGTVTNLSEKLQKICGRKDIAYETKVEGTDITIILTKQSTLAEEETMAIFQDIYDKISKQEDELIATLNDFLSETKYNTNISTLFLPPKQNSKKLQRKIFSYIYAENKGAVDLDFSIRLHQADLKIKEGFIRNFLKGNFGNALNCGTQMTSSIMKFRSRKSKKKRSQKLKRRSRKLKRPQTTAKPKRRSR